MSKRQELICLAYDKRGRLLSVGRNSYQRTHRVQWKYAVKEGKPAAVFLHAEIDALIRARGKKVHRVFVSRSDAHGKLAMAKPCPICQRALDDFGVKIVEWTTGE